MEVIKSEIHKTVNLLIHISCTQFRYCTSGIILTSYNTIWTINIYTVDFIPKCRVTKKTSQILLNTIVLIYNKHSKDCEIYSLLSNITSIT